jgi:hypothetical protein
MPGGEQERSAYGLIKFDNSPSAESFYNLNLYTLANGKMLLINYLTKRNLLSMQLNVVIVQLN